ncbi:MAG: PKD domain-containing protein, partial [Thermoplasmata archaeon]
GIVWTHDSLEYIWDYGPDLEVPAGVDCDLNPYNVTGLNIPNAEIIMDHEILHNLFEIGNIGDLIPKTPYPPPWFHYTHTDQSYVTTADIIIQHDTLPGSINFYLTTEEYGQGRVALDVIGHTVAAEDGTFLGIPSLKECQILVNAIYWVAKGKKMPNIISYSWDFDANVDSDGDGNNTNDADATGPTPTHIYGDNGVYIVTLKITDETGATAADTCNITVLNVAPTVDLNGPYSGSEGSPITFTSMATDPGSDDLTLTWNWGDGTPAITSTYYNNGIGPEPIYDPPTNEIKSPEGTFPFDVTDTLSHTYGDNGVYTITLTVVDDDGKTTVITADVVVNNVAPAITLVITPSGNEGSTLTFEADATDAGSDDLVFSWEFEYGPTIDNTYYNNGVSPEPVYDPITNEIKSPQGTYPFNASDMVTHTYGDNYDYTLVLTVYDDDDGISVYTTTITIDNVAPSIIELAIPYVAYEGTSAAYRATAKDLGSDDLTFEWDFGDSTPVIEKTFYNNGTTPDPYPSPDGILPFIAQDTLDHTYGDNYNYTLTFKVTDDDGGVTTLTTTVYVNNVAPTIEPFGPFAVDEGMPLDLTAISTDLGSDDLTFTWEFEYGPTITNAHYNDGVNPDPYPSPGGNYPFNVTDTVTHTYGDNGVFTVTLTVTDDDDGLAIYTTNITVNNVAPTINPIWPMALIFEGTPFILSANSTDQGSDDLTFTWEFELGPTITNIYYNDGTNLDPYPSPWGTYPFSAVDQVSLTYGDNGVYAVTVTVEDDDKGIAYFTANIIVYNLAPTIEPFGPFTVDEGKHVDITATSTDPGSDDLTFTWQFDYGPTYVSSYYNDGTGPDPYPSPWGTYPFSVLDDVTHTYGDNGVFLVILMVEDDDGGSTTFITNITVKNMAPAIENIEAYMYANISLRVAGEKYHSVDIYLYEENSKIWTGKVTRYPGSPDEQKATITNVKLDMTKRYSAKVDYLPNDPRVNGNVWGGNPVWIEIEARYGSTAHIHHTFNVRQSYWDSDHWNHIDPWEVELNPKLVGLNITFEAEASDPGSDDLEFTWDFGDSNSSGSNIYYNNGLSPDPYPSPEINPMIAIDTCIHAYTSPNIYTITIVVTDDDGGFSTTTLLIILSG